MNATIYPINTLRNLAINFITTSHYLNLDMDLWPSCKFKHKEMKSDF